MKMTVISIVIVLGTIPQGLVKRRGHLKVRGQVETLQTTSLRSDRILRRVPET